MECGAMNRRKLQSALGQGRGVSIYERYVLGEIFPLKEGPAFADPFFLGSGCADNRARGEIRGQQRGVQLHHPPGRCVEPPSYVRKVFTGLNGIASAAGAELTGTCGRRTVARACG